MENKIAQKKKVHFLNKIYGLLMEKKNTTICCSQNLFLSLVRFTQSSSPTTYTGHHDDQ